MRRANGTVDCVGNLAGGVQRLTGVRALAVGFGYACVVRRDATVWCWGSYWDPWPAGVAPSQVLGVTDAARISVGATDACAVERAGTVRCWSMADDAAARTRPVHARPIAGVTDAIDVATGIGHACALRRDGSVRCWGAREPEILAPGAPEDDALVDPGVSGATQLTAGSRHSCARLADGGVQCWGSNEFGALGLPIQLGAPPPVARRVAWP